MNQNHPINLNLSNHNINLKNLGLSLRKDIQSQYNVNIYREYSIRSKIAIRANLEDFSFHLELQLSLDNGD